MGMRLSWNEIKRRAGEFAKDWADAHRERGETHLFYNAFFNVFGIQARRVAVFEEHVKKLGDSPGFVDLLWPGMLLVEQKSAGRDLVKAWDQAMEYADALDAAAMPRYILVSDFQTFHLTDLDTREEWRFALEDFPKHVYEFGFMIGAQKHVFRDQDPCNIKAAELVGKLHDMLDETGYTGHDLERFLVRIVFCLFADDTGIFEPRDIFLDYLEERTAKDGSDLGARLLHLFSILDKPVSQRSNTLDEDLKQFPYVNGALFEGRLEFPNFTAPMRDALLDACKFDWSDISPAIFGSLFQSVMDTTERRKHGAHYTTERNILKVIEPLFLDDLREEFDHIKILKRGRLSRLRKFQQKLRSLRFFDPACGCGNFLVIAYRELRLLELDVLKAIHESDDVQAGRQQDLAAEMLSVVDVDQFYGIELSEFPVRIAETALWMMDHLMNNELSLAFGETYTRIPLRKSPTIVHGDALEIDWEGVLPSKDCSYVFGNPPFLGWRYRDSEQSAQIRRIAKKGPGVGRLDYVSGWFIKSGEYISAGRGRIGFVATNSITQGEQVGVLWPILFERYNLEIAFAHRTFAWGSNARGKAHVHVVIIGLDLKERARTKKRLFIYPDINGNPLESQHSAISPYLFDASGLLNPYITVRRAAVPSNGLKNLRDGSKIVDGGHYTFSTVEKERFLELEPAATEFMYPFVSAQDFLQGEPRWILSLQTAAPNVLAQLPHVRERINAVRTYRESRKSKGTRKFAKIPTSYYDSVIPDESFLAIPVTSSERREYIPIGWLDPPTIPSNQLRVLRGATLGDFALLTSAMHMAWMRTVAGRLKSDFRYSTGVVYNTFPTPPLGADLTSLEPLAQSILDARARYPDSTLANLYDPNLMPSDLQRAHQKLDRAVDKLYDRQGFKSEDARLSHLFMRYEQMVSPIR